MSVGAWEPANQASNDQSGQQIDRALLEQILEFMECPTAPATDSQEASDLQYAAGPTAMHAPALDPTTLPASLQSAHWLAGLPTSQWLQEASHWQPQQVWGLIRFFTLAESSLDWPGGAESPVIPLAKSLRQRKSPLNKAQLMWIREHTDNRYLPYGPL
ncbi:hypothetical protein HXX02_10130 [Microbulbifer elongatus]|uniref:Uncharacterized protein n=1 Tax=Microbulbifer elongatus TaxID=86173 RepID=A0ABT1P2Q9_9GAMM|nr:hypothetical protein [Microbulbifer elongatus]MCQ3829802.1 hypothetical protein [Microbulbifer elongatus]